MSIVKVEKLSLKIVGNLTEKFNLFSSTDKVAQVFQRNLLPFQKQLVQLKIQFFENPVRMTKDDVFSILIGFAFKRNHILYETFRDVFQAFFEGGIISKLYNDLTSSLLNAADKIISEYEEKATETVLTWDHLYAGFYVWIGACVLSTFAFVAELTTHYLQRKRK